MSYRFRGNKRVYRTSYKPRPSKTKKERYISPATEPIEQEAYVVKHNFSDFGLHPALLKNISQHGYKVPTPIQDQSIPVVMEGKDIVGIANTGTGKTAAFLLPLIHKVLNDNNQGVFIITPTRELAIQISQELKAFSQGLNLGSSLCIGGANIKQQISQLQRNPHFIIGTPGRLKDLINRNVINTKMYTNIVLDEVDRMLDIGFRKDISYLVSRLPSKRHTLFFSATVNRDAQAIMDQYLTQPITVSVKKTDSIDQIDQDIVTIKPGENKIDVLHQLLLKDGFEKVIVFGRTKRGINKLERTLYKRGIRVNSIHGNKSQNARERSLQQFKQGRVQALLATDIVARGIDISDVTHVINFDEPATYDDYIHRIGRTGRAGNSGKALTFVF